MSKPKTPAKPPTPTTPKRKAAARRSGQAHARPTGQRRGPAASDVVGLLVLGLTAALAACSPKGNHNASGNGATTTTGLSGGAVTVQFLDVGQGDSVLIRSPEGKTMLVDGGKSTNRMADYMSQLNISKIDLMVATHADSDHIAGLVEAAKAKPTLFINNGIGGTTQTWNRLVSALQAQGTQFQTASGQVINLGSVKVHVVAPPDGMPNNQNDHSVGIRLNFGKFSALMTGDSETPETNGWLAEKNPQVQGPITVYKSIHHGAANGDHQAWLDVVRPQNVVISVGPNNYGHPTQSALDLYTANKVHIYRTDQHGTVTFTGKADGSYKVSTEK
ncbi:ComEC/Rec2 family competence protein [Deinococcus sp.]|uniref:ComEC/Rec2 family competence protein n=1 Tax=Deinococcus sp. TaxID=47478 RepID=UPI0025B7BCD9|nr:ComEC/Rec2 family competence protein [Deinococcus sp.]